ncbi:glutaminase [Actinacidiphila oryziradicis]|uniref:glutaminase n=1 Tax=Actinacidiphila oryziradicis TaxID=2571141 RepID=UPI00389932C1
MRGDGGRPAGARHRQGGRLHTGALPGRGALCAWSPALDQAGNSLAAVGALDAFVTATGWSVF